MSAQPSDEPAERAAALRRDGFHAEADRSDGTVVIRLHGELDLATAPKLVRALAEGLDGKPSGLVLDLSQLSFIDSTGIGVLMTGYRRADADGCSFVLRAPSRGVLRTLQVTGVAHMVLTEAPEAPIS